MFLLPYWQKSCPVNWFAWHVFTSSVSTHTFTGLIGFTGVIGFTSCCVALEAAFEVALEVALGAVVGAVVGVVVGAVVVTVVRALSWARIASAQYMPS